MSLVVVSHSVGTEIFKPDHRLFISQRSYHHRRKACATLRRSFSLNGIVAAGVSAAGSLLSEAPVKGMERLPFKPEGYNFWNWRGHKIHYVEQGEGHPIVLIHGFGASAFHWRYNILELAKIYKVYAIDLLGFGWSEKAIIEYDALVWRDQVADFLKEIVKEPAVLVGNSGHLMRIRLEDSMFSTVGDGATRFQGFKAIPVARFTSQSLGGFTALITAAELPEQVLGVVLLNSAGQFANPGGETNDKSGETAFQKFLVKPLKEIFQRVVLGFLFWQAKQPARIQSVLKSVYSNASNVDDYLVESITRPAADPNAGEVYYRLMTRFMLNQTQYTLDSVLCKLSCPLLLLWGDLDPWVGPAKANKIKEFYPNSSLVNFQAGHCPHDEVPVLVNTALIDWLSSLKLDASLQTL